MVISFLTIELEILIKFTPRTPWNTEKKLQKLGKYDHFN